MLHKDSTFAAVGCYASLSAFESLFLFDAVCRFLLPHADAAVGLQEASRQGR